MMREGVSTYTRVAPTSDVAAADTVCETVLAWLVRPPTAPLAWDEAAWEDARWASTVHGIAPLLYHRLHELPAWALLHPVYRQWVSDQYALNGIRIHRMMSDLERILNRAHDAGISVVPLKGSTSIYTLYKNPALRPMADLDVLVRPEAESRFVEILAELGYEAEEQTPRHRSYSHPARRSVVSTRGEHPDNPRGIQVHSEVAEQFWGSTYTVTDALWEGKWHKFGSATAWLSQPLGFMQHLLVHASADIIAGKARLVRFYDIYLLAERFDEAHWEALVQAGLHRKEARWLYSALYFTARYFNAPVPENVMAQLGAHTPPALRNFLESSSLRYLSFCNPLRVSLNDRLTWHTPGIERTKAVVHCLFPSPDQIREYYPHLAGQLPLAYGKHLGSMADGFRRTVFRIPRRSWLRREHGGK